MVVYGIYGILLVSGLVVLLVVAQGRLSEASTKHQSQLVLPYFVLTIVLFLTLLNVFPGLYGNFPALVLVFGTLVVGLVILTVFLMVRTELNRQDAARRTAQTMVKKYDDALRKDPSDFGAHAGLARALEGSGKYALAAEEYSTASGMCSEDAKKYAERLSRMADVMRKLSHSDEARRTYRCPRCSSGNRPLQRLCSECGGQLYGHTLRWVWVNTSVATRVAALVVVMFSSLFFIKLPVTYGLTLMGVWLALVVYFSLPWEKFSHI